MYTALQFFKGEPSDTVRFIQAADGVLAPIDWADEDNAVPYATLRREDTWWLLLPANERSVLDSIFANAHRLGDPGVTSGVFQGLITSADRIFQLYRIAPGTDVPRTGSRIEVRLEDEIMLPLIDGKRATRYTASIL